MKVSQAIALLSQHDPDAELVFDFEELDHDTHYVSTVTHIDDVYDADGWISAEGHPVVCLETSTDVRTIHSRIDPCPEDEIILIVPTDLAESVSEFGWTTNSLTVMAKIIREAIQ